MLVSTNVKSTAFMRSSTTGAPPGMQKFTTLPGNFIVEQPWNSDSTSGTIEPAPLPPPPFIPTTMNRSNSGTAAAAIVCTLAL